MHVYSNRQRGSDSRNVLEMSQLLKGPKPFLNLFVVQDSQTVKTKGFYCKGRHHTPEDDCLLERLDRMIAGGRQVAQETAGKGISRTGWITHVFKRKGRSPEYLLLVEHQDSVLPALDDKVLGPPCEYFLCDLHQIRIFAQRPSLSIVHDQNVDLLQHPPQRISLAVDPKVHRIARNQRRARELLEYI